MEHLCHHPAAEQTAVGNPALCDNVTEEWVVVIQYDEFAAFVGCDTLASIRPPYRKQTAYIHTGITKRFDTVLGCFG